MTKKSSTSYFVRYAEKLESGEFGKIKTFVFGNIHDQQEFLKFHEDSKDVAVIEYGRVVKK